MTELSTALDRVKAALAAKQPPRRKDLEHALRETFGLSRRQAEKFCALGLRGLDATGEGALRELTERLAAMEATLGKVSS